MTHLIYRDQVCTDTRVRSLYLPISGFLRYSESAGCFCARKYFLIFFRCD